ncbi:hypothetical protein B0T19DRAFT_397118 [Cercophora scortea]|uniref:Uncharacterized protein n=1 Tax=Cercophora scortea TaxID=314031 RepID=A0AAE0J775_9PEZI|nr:hypothetical protein B0T19DRAFT_397118 [Cercophora scortea]
MRQANTTKDPLMAPESVEQLLALDTHGLVEFIKTNLGSFEAIDFTSIKDLNRVSESQQTELLQRLYPADFSQQLLAKLEDVHSRRKEARNSPPTSPEPRLLSLSPQPEIGKEHQIRCYHELVNDGGRPPCSLETLDKIYRSPSDFLELLGPWIENPAPRDPDDLGVFSRPLARWKEFRRWQHHNRGSISTADDSPAAFVEEKRRYLESTGNWSITTEPYFEETMRSMEVKDGSFAQYEKAARHRLAKHGFREVFRLLKDPRQQNERVEWIEYLEFECWWQDVNAQTVQRHKPSHDAAWEKLVKSGVLRTGETEEDLFTSPISDPDQQNNTPRDEAIRGFMGQTKAYRDAKAVECRQSLRVQWALNQMPKKPEVARKPAARTGKRRRLQEDEEAPEVVEEEEEERPTAKRQRTEQESVDRPLGILREVT